MIATRSHGVATLVDLQLDSARLEEMEELTDRIADLEASNSEAEAFSSSVAHELGSPLTAIGYLSDVLLHGYASDLDERGARCVSTLRDAALQMEHLVASLLDLGRTSHQPIQRESVDMSALARSVASALRERDPERIVDIRIEPGLTGEGDAVLLRVVLTNLLGNAWKYTRNRPTASIEFGHVLLEDEPVFFVRDNGIGFEADLAPSIFAPFRRLHASEDFEGEGIGLATVERIVMRHGGRVWAAAEPDKGAVFYFTLGDAGREAAA